MSDTNINENLSVEQPVKPSFKKKLVKRLFIVSTVLLLLFGLAFTYYNYFLKPNESTDITNIQTQDVSDVPEEFVEFYVVEDWKIAKFEPTLVDFTTDGDQNFMIAKYNDVTFKIFLTGKISDNESKDFITFTSKEGSFPKDTSFIKDFFKEGDKVGIYYFIDYPALSVRTKEYCEDKFSSFCKIAAFSDIIKTDNKLITSPFELDSKGVIPAIEVYALD